MQGGESKSDPCKGGVGVRWVTGDGTAEQPYSHPYHEFWQPHHTMELPGNKAVEFPLPIPTTFGG